MSTALEPRVSDLERAMRNMAYAQMETQRSIRELGEEMAEFKNEMAEFKNEMRQRSRAMDRRWGDLANRMGTLVEDIVAPSIPGVLQRFFGEDEPDTLMIRVRRKHPVSRDRIREFDVIAVTPGFVYVNETKSTLRAEYVTAFADNYREVTEFFPEFAEKPIVPIMSSLYISPELLALLTQHRVYAMGMGKDTMDLLNFDTVHQTRG